MGTFGAGNFDSDSAWLMLCSVLDVVDAELRSFVTSEPPAVEDLEPILACVAIKLALIERCGAERPGVDEANALREKVVDTFDRKFDDLNPVPGHKDARRKVIVDTLDEYVRVADPDPDR